MSTDQRSHIVPDGKAIFAIRIIQAALAFVILGSMAFNVAVFGGWSAFGLGLFTSIATLIITIYYLVSSTKCPVAYNRWAVLALDIFAVIFWLISFSLCANWAALAVTTNYAYSGSSSDYSSYDSYGYYRRRSIQKRDYYVGIGFAAWVLEVVSAALGGIEFVLFIVTLIFFSVRLHRHRKQGFHSTYGSSQTLASQEAKPAGENHHEMQV